MTDRDSADKGTDDVRGTGDVPAETGQPSKGAAVRGGASGADRDAEPGAAQRPANTPVEQRDDVAEAPKAEPDTRSSAAGAGGETESVSSVQISEDVPAGGAAGGTGKPETVASAQAAEGAGATGNADPESVRHSAAEGSRKETPIYESVRRAAERAEQVEADTATAAERGAAGIPGPVSGPGRTLLEMLRDKPILAAIPASTLAFILWRAFHRR
jgi:hypothetical protein